MLTKSILSAYQNSTKTIVKTDDFAYILPNKALKNWISNYSITFPKKGLMKDNYTVLPHGSATLVFSQYSHNIKSLLFGPSTLPCTVGKSANEAKIIFIIEFQPSGLYIYTKENQSLIANQCFDFSLINPILDKLICENMELCQSIDDFINKIDELLLSFAMATVPKQLNYAIQSIITSSGNLSVKALSSYVSYSDRQLNRIFENHIGTNIKSFSRLVRINKAIKLLHIPELSISKISTISGFYDLSHFVHDFKLLCSITPQEYRNNYTTYYSEIAKF